jgi:hypothetical protein
MFIEVFVAGSCVLVYLVIAAIWLIHFFTDIDWQGWSRLQIAFYITGALVLALFWPGTMTMSLMQRLIKRERGENV